MIQLPSVGGSSSLLKNGASPDWIIAVVVAWLITYKNKNVGGTDLSPKQFCNFLRYNVCFC